MIETSDSLLGRLRGDNAHDAWQEFFDAYWGAIMRYGCKVGLTKDQAEEVLQDTMVALIRVLPEFAYDRRKGRFRNFLLTIVHRRAMYVLERGARNRSLVWNEALEETLSGRGREDEGPDHEALLRWRDSLLEEALRRMRDDPRLGESTFGVFEAYVIERHPAEEVALKFGVTVNAVYQVRNRLLRRLKMEVGMLMKSGGMS
jgi:RNA polymerase sigma factor (sigma-70 family)